MVDVKNTMVKDKTLIFKDYNSSYKKSHIIWPSIKPWNIQSLGDHFFCDIEVGGEENSIMDK